MPEGETSDGGATIDSGVKRRVVKSMKLVPERVFGSRVAVKLVLDKLY
jgi:hypothetical protein